MHQPDTGSKLVPMVLVGLVMASMAVAQPAARAPGAGSALVGRIVGTVRDSTGVAIPFANITVPELHRGAMASEKGAYVLEGVPVGTITVRAQGAGYAAKVRTIDIDAGRTATLDFALGISAIELPTIDVIAKTRDVKASDTRYHLTDKSIRDLPTVDNLAMAVATKAGVVAMADGLHVRGGRVTDVKLQNDAIDVSNPATGVNPNVAPLAISGVEVLSGGYDAEYGNALGGIISVTTKEGTDRFGGEMRWDTDRYGDPSKTYDDFDRITFGLGGPTPIKRLTWFATYEGAFTDTYLKSSMTHSRHALFDFIQMGYRQNNAINMNLKLAYRATPQQKFTLEGIDNHTINTPYNHVWSRQGYVRVVTDSLPTGPLQRYGTWSATPDDSSFVAENLPDHVPTTDDRFQQWIGVWTDQLSDKRVWTTRVSSVRYQTLTTVAGKQPWEYDIQSPEYWNGNTGPGSEANPYFATHGDLPRYARRASSTWTVKSDLATELMRHRFKTGVEVRYNTVENLVLSLPNSETNGLPGGTRSAFLNHNPEAAAYVQDRWDFESLVLNFGVRYDMFTPGAGISNADLPSGRRYKQQISPRLGIAYPISDRDVLSFHYGWTYQTPARNFIFENRGVGAAVVIQGNPDLEPETNISYQAGVQHLFSKDVSGQFSVFFKDIFGQLTTRQVPNDPQQTLFWANGDYASARGFEASVVKSFSHKFSTEVNYSYQLATGVASDPGSAQQFFNGGRLYLPITEQPLAWDQRHTVSLQGVLRDPGRWGLRMLWVYGSGFPFTPAFRNDRRPDPQLENSRRQPANSTLTIDADKFYKIWGQNITVFVDARNLLDTRNLTALQQDTFPNPFLNTAGNDYLIYYTETGRAGGAYLKDVNGDNVLDWVPVKDPRVFQEGRSLRTGVSIVF